MAEAVQTQAAPMNRREFLYYIWGASMTLLLGGAGGAILWYLYPRFREGEFGGVFRVPIAGLPAVGESPEENAAGRFWLVQIGGGALALYKVCTHLGCLYKWVPNNDRFECPCHGSKFERNGTKIEGPAPRDLDIFTMDILDADGNVLASTPEEGGPIPVPDGAAELAINTGNRIEGDPAAV